MRYSVIFWPEASPEEAKFRFKNTVYRLRRAVGKDSILLEQDFYRFNNKMDYEYDVELFLKENAAASREHDLKCKTFTFVGSSETLWGKIPAGN